MLYNIYIVHLSTTVLVGYKFFFVVMYLQNIFVNAQYDRLPGIHGYSLAHHGDLGASLSAGNIL